jgi:hypothetical protein
MRDSNGTMTGQCSSDYPCKLGRVLAVLGLRELQKAPGEHEAAAVQDPRTEVLSPPEADCRRNS